MGLEHVPQNSASTFSEKENRFRPERSMAAGPGQNVEEEYREPVMWRQEEQWQMWPWRGSEDMGIVVV
jgi:hypothetical protein